MSGKQVVRRLLVYAVQHSRVVAAVLIIAGYVGLFLLPLIYRNNFFDENSLLVANSVPDVWNYVKKYQPDLLKRNSLQSLHQDLHSKPLDHLLRQYGLTAVRQEFSSLSGNVTCSNYHVTTPASRGDGSESLALVTPLSSGCANEQSAGARSFREPCWRQSQAAGVTAVSAGVALSQHLAAVPWLARDFYWVIPDASCGLIHSTQAWIDAARGYRDTGSQHTASTRVGLLQQALVLEIQSMGQAEGAPKNTKLIEVSGMGFNGLLPKLDFFMLAEYFFRMDARAQIKVPWRPTPLLSAVRFVLNWSKEALNDLPSSWAAYGPVKEVQKQLGTGKYRDQLLGTLSFLGMQVGGNPDGAHAAFKDYAVDAVTARVGAGIDEAADSIDSINHNQVLRLAAAAEGVLRCSNNLLERLHHSYFMYLQPTPKTFITIETYVLPACLMLLGLFLMAVSSIMLTNSTSTQCSQSISNNKSAPENPASTEPVLEAIGSAKPGVSSSSSSGLDEGDKMENDNDKNRVVFPEKIPQPMRLQGGWPEISRGVCAVLAVHGVCGLAGLALHWALAQHKGGHEVWDALESDISISVLVSGGVSAVGLMVLLSINARSVGTRDTQPDKQQQKQQQRITASPKAIQVERSISLFLTVLLMAAWMFLNWADVYIALLCLVPNLVLSNWSKAHYLSPLMPAAWLVINPWIAAMAWNMPTAELPGGSDFMHLLHIKWLSEVSFVTYLFVWIVYVPSWISPWWSGYVSPF